LKLNKHQRAWIKALKSGETRKAVGAMVKRGGSMCCLGVAVKTIGTLSLKVCRDNDVCTLDPSFFPTEYANLNLNGEYGKIDTSRLSKKTIAALSALKKKNKDYVDDQSFFSLAGLNDCTKMSHVDIGNFIDKNREAVFLGE
jgi:hypothetical protein